MVFVRLVKIFYKKFILLDKALLNTIRNFFSKAFIRQRIREFSLKSKKNLV